MSAVSRPWSAGAVRRPSTSRATVSPARSGRVSVAGYRTPKSTQPLKNNQSQFAQSQLNNENSLSTASNTTTVENPAQCRRTTASSPVSPGSAGKRPRQNRAIHARISPARFTVGPTSTWYTLMLPVGRAHCFPGSSYGAGQRDEAWEGEDED